MERNPPTSCTILEGAHSPSRLNTWGSSGWGSSGALQNLANAGPEAPASEACAGWQGARKNF